MKHPNLMSADASTRYQQLLDEATVERQYRQQGHRSNLVTQGANLLIAAGRKLQSQSQATPSTPAFRTK